MAVNLLTGLTFLHGQQIGFLLLAQLILLELLLLLHIDMLIELGEKVLNLLVEAHGLHPILHDLANRVVALVPVLVAVHLDTSVWIYPAGLRLLLLGLVGPYLLHLLLLLRRFLRILSWLSELLRVQRQSLLLHLVYLFRGMLWLLGGDRYLLLFGLVAVPCGDGLRLLHVTLALLWIRDLLLRGLLWKSFLGLRL
jgi:hypothetical protein